MLSPQAAVNKYLASVKGNSLSGAYRRCFEIIAANSPVLREKAYRLRYQIYCREHRFESREAHPNQLETDEYDYRSIQSLIINRASGEAIGTVRLILPDQTALESSFPIQKICSQFLPSNLSISGAAEISRFAISKMMQKKANGSFANNPNFSIALGLMRAIVQMSLKHDITDWLAVMEPSLLRLLNRFGICFTQIGPLVEYHGMRQPCHANLYALLAKVYRENFDLWEFVTESSNSQSL